MQSETNDQFREFSISKGKRRANSFHLMGSTIGGKIAIGLIVALLLMAVLSPLYVPSIIDSLYGGDAAKYTETAASIGAEWVAEQVEEERKYMAIAVPIFWLVMALMAIGCTFRQRNVGVAMRVNEHLALNRSTLTYSFHASGDRHSAVSLNVIMIDLEASMITYDETQRHWVFEGGVFGHYYRYPEDEPLLSMQEMEPIPRFTISSHFEDPFDDIMQTFAKGGQR